MGFLPQGADDDDLGARVGEVRDDQSHTADGDVTGDGLGGDVSVLLQRLGPAANRCQLFVLNVAEMVVAEAAPGCASC